VRGRFELAAPSQAPVDVIVQHPSYLIFAQANVPAGSSVQIRLRPSSIEAEPVEIVETREEDLRPMIVRQDPISLPAKYRFGTKAGQVQGVYRVCVGKDGKVSLVAPIESAGVYDPYVMKSIATGWEYRALLNPACFYWRVTLRFNPTDTKLPPPPVIEQSAPQGPPFRTP